MVNLLTSLCASMRFTFGFELYVLPTTERVLIKFGNRNGLAFLYRAFLVWLTAQSILDYKPHLTIPCTLYLTLWAHYLSKISLICMSDCWRKPEHPQRGQRKNKQTPHKGPQSQVKVSTAPLCKFLIKLDYTLPPSLWASCQGCCQLLLEPEDQERTHQKGWQGGESIPGCYHCKVTVLITGERKLLSFLISLTSRVHRVKRISQLSWELYIFSELHFTGMFWLELHIMHRRNVLNWIEQVGTEG